MNQPQLLASSNPPTWLKILVIILLGLGVFFRFAHLGQKIYCCDESWTSVAISGNTVAELRQEVSHHQGTIPITTFDDCLRSIFGDRTVYLHAILRNVR